MKKLLIYFICSVVAFVTFSSCSKDELYWRVETSPIEYYDYSDYQRFESDIYALNDDITWTISQVQREVQDIVNRYNGDLSGKVYLKTGPTMTGPWTLKKTWTMSFN